MLSLPKRAEVAMLDYQAVVQCAMGAIGPGRQGYKRACTTLTLAADAGAGVEHQKHKVPFAFSQFVSGVTRSDGRADFMAKGLILRFLRRVTVTRCDSTVVFVARKSPFDLVDSCQGFEPLNVAGEHLLAVS